MSNATCCMPKACNWCVLMCRVTKMQCTVHESPLEKLVGQVGWVLGGCGCCFVTAASGTLASCFTAFTYSAAFHHDITFDPVKKPNPVLSLPSAPPPPQHSTLSKRMLLVKSCQSIHCMPQHPKTFTSMKSTTKSIKAVHGMPKPS